MRGTGFLFEPFSTAFISGFSTFEVRGPGLIPSHMQPSFTWEARADDAG
jgi:hypothetical protein